MHLAHIFTGVIANGCSFCAYFFGLSKVYGILSIHPLTCARANDASVYTRRIQFSIGDNECLMSVKTGESGI